MIPSTGDHQAEVVTFGPFSVDRGDGVLRKDGRDVSVPPKAFEVLLCLLQRPGAVVPKEELLNAVWGDTAVTDGSLTEAVRALRAALGDNPRRPAYIQTVHRRGYRFIADVTAVPVATAAAGAEGPSGPAGAGTASPAATATTTDAETRAASTPPGPSVTPAATPLERWSRRWLTPALAVLAVGALLGVVYTSLEGDPVSETTAAFIFGPPPDTFFFDQSHGLSISPDGSTVVFSATSTTDPHHLYARRLGELEPRPLLATVGRWALSPFFARDGRSVGYYSGRGSGLEVVDLVNSKSRVLCHECAQGAYGAADFAYDGTVLFAGPRPSGGHVIWEIPPGGTPEPLLDDEDIEEDVDYLWPHALPGDQWLLVTLRRGHTIEGARIVALNRTTGEHRYLIDDGFSARYVPDRDRSGGGHLVFGRDGGLWAVAFDARDPALRGEPVPVPLEKQVAMNAENGSAGFDVSETGTLAYHPGVFARRTYRLAVLGSDGTTVPIGDPAFFRSARVSPDGNRVAACVRAKREEIRVYDLRDGSDFTIRNSSSDFCSPVWSPDSTAIAFVADGRDIYVKASRQRDPDLLASMDDLVVDLAGWSPEGQVVATTFSGEHGDIWTIDADCPTGPVEGPCGPHHHRLLLASEQNEWAHRLSPDGKWLALSIDWVIQVVPFPAGGPPVEVALGTWSRWSADGSELYFYATQREQGWRAVPWRGSDDFDATEIRRRRVPPRISPEDVLPDGTIIGIDKRTEQMPTTEIVVITGWAEQLMRLAPATR